MSFDSKTIPLPWTTVYAKSTTAVFHPASGWVDAGDVEEARCTWEFCNRAGPATDGCRVAVAFQATNDPSTPGSINYVEDTTGGAQYRTTAGLQYAEPFKDITGGTQDKQVIRVGWATKNGTNTGGTTINPVRVSGMVFVRRKG